MDEVLITKTAFWAYDVLTYGGGDKGWRTRTAIRDLINNRVTDNSAIYKHSWFLVVFLVPLVCGSLNSISHSWGYCDPSCFYIVFILKQKRNVENITTQVSLIKPSFITSIWYKKAENQWVNNTYCNREWFKKRGRFLWDFFSVFVVMDAGLLQQKEVHRISINMFTYFI